MPNKKKEETSSPELAKLASEVLRTGKATPKQAKSLAGGVLTNAANKPKAAPAPKKRGK